MFLNNIKRTWHDSFIQVFDDMPESDGFVADVADKQIEDLISLVMLLGKTVTELELQQHKMAEKLMGKPIDIKLDVEEEEYKPSEIDENKSNIYM